MNTAKYSSLTISGSADLNKLLDRKNVIDKIEIQSDRLNPREKQLIEKRINHLYHACGCTFGTACLLTGILFSIPYFTLQVKLGIHTVTQSLMGGFAICAALLIVGKLLGFVYREIQLRREIRKLRQMLHIPLKLNTDSGGG